jgi:hypothetical protein
MEPATAANRSPLLLGAAALVSLVLSGLVLLARPWGVGHLLGLVLGALTLLAAFKAWRTGSLRDAGLVLLALSLQIGIFLLSAAGTPPLTRFRLVQTAAILGYVAILGGLLLVRMGGYAPRRAALVASAAALGILAGDRILGLGAPADRLPARRDWPDSSDRHPRLGRVPRPYSDYKTYYTDDRRGYLLEEDLRTKTWDLAVMPGSSAELVLPPDDPALLRVAIRKGNPDSIWTVQLMHSRFAIARQTPYYITLRARADHPRKAILIFAQHHPPWAELGLRHELNLTREWQEFREVFVARRADTNAMIAFHLAGSDVPVEVAAVTLHGPPSGQKIDPALARTRFFVRHQRNALGCRDRDYVSPPPKQTVRILTLGDGFTSGLGVHEKDTFAKQLERELNGQSSRTPQTAGYEVINCGVPGYGTHEQRLFFELFGATYKPDVVLVTMAWNDDRFYWEASRRELFKRPPGRIEQLSSVARKIDASVRLWRSHDYRRSVQDLLALDKAARAQGARLIVAVSRHGPAGLGDSLLATVGRGIKGSAIALLDLGAPAAPDSGKRNPNAPPGPAAHRAAALELFRWLRQDVLPSPAVTARVP